MISFPDMNVVNSSNKFICALLQTTFEWPFMYVYLCSVYVCRYYVCKMQNAGSKKGGFHIDKEI